MQKRVVAIATALALVCVGFLAQHHEAEAAHAREQSGRIVHAQELADHHVVGANAHLHESAKHEHAGDCSLLAVLHAPIHETRAVAIIVAPALTVAVLAPIATPPRVAIAGYRIAPKTSPPVA
jgi:hypothetical protein